MGRWGDGEMGRWGDGEMGRWGDGEMGRWGDERIFLPTYAIGWRGVALAFSLFSFLNFHNL
ncbi:MAG: hypothetical protein F6K23_25335 [Okeania sp. SIO2C9]|uniref:hypothetical protein n=1 Tax=Okeania sp. SIO2C9 TaxID=2607791 RepID=UPI0013C29575|nr:hypothetical protein [Okeania sp. SIO2C9]NEQ76068.1 hypothetical protein [Okeania sp. SIO2C9]